MRSRTWLALLLTSGCGSDESQELPPPAACAAPEVAIADGSCIRPGVPPEGCAPGFVHDGEYGCDPILPASPCSAGLMAVPGEEACRPVAPCGRGKWGDIGVDATTIYVDQSYPGAGNGTTEAPFATLSQALAAAPSGAVIAIAEGRYVEDLMLDEKSVRLWGVCPEKVELVGGWGAAAIVIFPLGSGTEVRGITVSGSAAGIAGSGAQFGIREVRVHAAITGIHAESTFGATSVTVADSLVEENRDAGMSFFGGEATVQRSVVRATADGPDNDGKGIVVQPLCSATSCDPNERAHAVLQDSLIEQNHATGVHIGGSSASLEGMVVRGTRPREGDQMLGMGITVQQACSDAGCDPTMRSNVTVKSSVSAENHYAGLLVNASDVAIDHAIFRDTEVQPADGEHGRGITIQLGCHDGSCDPMTRANVAVRTSLIERNREVGFLVVGSDATMDATVVRDTRARSSDQLFGQAVYAMACMPDRGCASPATSTLAISRSLFDHNRLAGLVISGSNATAEAIVVRNTEPREVDGKFGRGINAQSACNDVGVCDPSVPSIVGVSRSVIENNRDVGVLAVHSDLTLEDSLVRGTQPNGRDGLFGDGILLLQTVRPSSATIARTRIEHSARAGIANFGAHASMEDTLIRCAAFPLTGQSDFVFEDRGGNGCGCPEPDGDCKVAFTELGVPEPLPAIEGQ